MKKHSAIPRLLFMLTLLLTGCKKEPTATPVIPAVPTIRNVNPLSGRGGTLLTLTGENFTPSDFAATVNGKRAPVVRGTVSSTSAQIEVPADCGSGPIEITTGNKMARAANEFVYLFNRFTEMVYYVQDGRLWSMDIFQGRKQAATPTNLAYANAELILSGRPVTGSNLHRMVIFESNGTGGGGYSDLRDGGPIDGLVSGSYGSGRTSGWLGVQSATASKVRPGSLYYLWNRRAIYEGSIVSLNGNFLQPNQLRVSYGNDMAFVCEVAGFLYVFQTNGAILTYRVNTTTGALEQQTTSSALAEWGRAGGFKAVTDLNGKLWFITAGGFLIRYDPVSNGILTASGRAPWTNAKTLTGVGEYLLLVEGEQAYLVDPQTFNSMPVGSNRLLIRAGNLTGFHN